MNSLELAEMLPVALGLVFMVVITAVLLAAKWR